MTHGETGVWREYALDAQHLGHEALTLCGLWRSMCADDPRRVPGELESDEEAGPIDCPACLASELCMLPAAD